MRKLASTRIRPVYFYARPYREALEAFREHTPGEYAFTDPADDGSYWKAFAEIWDDPGDFDLLMVEQDVVVHGDVLRQLQLCPGGWCEFRHPNRSDPSTLMHRTLGCTRFAAEVRREVPVSVQLERARLNDAPPSTWTPDGSRTWNALDGPLVWELSHRGWEWHVHEPPVRHLTAE